MFRQSHVELNKIMTDYLFSKRLYKVIAECSSPKLIKEIINEIKLLNCDLATRKEQTFLKEFINTRIIILLAKEGKYLDSSALDYLNENFTEEELKESVNDKQSLFDFLIEHYNPPKLINHINLPWNTIRKLRKMTNIPDYKYSSVQEEQEIYKKLDTLINILDTDNKSATLLIEILLSIYHNGTKKELVNNFIDTLIKLIQKNPEFRIKMTSTKLGTSFYSLANRIRISDIDMTTDESLIHELIHFIHYNELDYNTPTYFDNKNGIKEKIQNYRKLKRLVLSLYKKNKEELINYNKNIKEKYGFFIEDDSKHNFELAQEAYLTLSKSKNISIDILYEIYQRIIDSRKKARTNSLISINLLGILDSILEGDIHDEKIDSFFNFYLVAVGHPQEYFKEDNRHSYIEFLADYLAVKLTRPNYIEENKEIYKIIGPKKFEELEEQTENLFKLK